MKITCSSIPLNSKCDLKHMLDRYVTGTSSAQWGGTATFVQFPRPPLPAHSSFCWENITLEGYVFGDLSTPPPHLIHFSPLMKLMDLPFVPPSRSRKYPLEF
ncbi:unnamed protein product, partial [Sphacelaria rigidula]